MNSRLINKECRVLVWCMIERAHLYKGPWSSPITNCISNCISKRGVSAILLQSGYESCYSLDIFYNLNTSLATLLSYSLAIVLFSSYLKVAWGLEYLQLGKLKEFYEFDWLLFELVMTELDKTIWLAIVWFELIRILQFDWLQFA